jgi:hypothetical protein
VGPLRRAGGPFGRSANGGPGVPVTWLVQDGTYVRRVPSPSISSEASTVPMSAVGLSGTSCHCSRQTLVIFRSLSPADRRVVVSSSTVGLTEPAVQLRLAEELKEFAPLVASSAAIPLREPMRSEITGRKGSVFYRAHSYHTKVPPEGIARAIEHFTDPGDFVVDPFCGSGMTGVACLVTGRQGLLSDLSPAATHIAQNYVRPLDPARLKHAATAMLSRAAALEAELYATTCPGCSAPALVEYTVWSDVFSCPTCEAEIEFWTSALEPDGSIRSMIDCGECKASWRKRDLHWTSCTPVLQSISCRCCKRRQEHALAPDERGKWSACDRRDIPHWYPTAPFEPWREMWRGQHRDQRIDIAADFFTNRNLWALSAVWDMVNTESDERLRSALRFLFTSVVNRASRRYQWNPKRPTNVLSSTMYLASLSYEFNVFSLLRRKVRTLTDLFEATSWLPGRADVVQAPAQNLSHVPDSSVNYVFTDPPFGSNIFYADSSFLWEAWLGESTDMTKEAVVNQSVRAEHGGKSLADYERLMAGAFEEIDRVLRRNAWASVMFHNSSDEVWSALQRAIEMNGFEVGSAVAFDKSQASFKGIKGLSAGERVPSFDLVLHLHRAPRRVRSAESDSAVEEVIMRRLYEHVVGAPAQRRTTPYLHSLAMRVLLEEALPFDGFTYRRVEEICAELFEWDGKGWSKRAPAQAPAVRQP